MRLKEKDGRKWVLRKRRRKWDQKGFCDIFGRTFDLRLFFGGLHPKTTEEDLQEYVEQLLGRPGFPMLPHLFKQKNGQSARFGFVNFLGDEKAAQFVLNKVEQHVIHGSKVNVQVRTKTRADEPSRQTDILMTQVEQEVAFLKQSTN